MFEFYGLISISKICHYCGIRDKPEKGQLLINFLDVIFGWDSRISWFAVFTKNKKTQLFTFHTIFVPRSLAWIIICIILGCIRFIWCLKFVFCQIWFHWQEMFLSVQSSDWHSILISIRHMTVNEFKVRLQSCIAPVSFHSKILGRAGEGDHV